MEDPTPNAADADHERNDDEEQRRRRQREEQLEEMERLFLLEQETADANAAAAAAEHHDHDERLHHHGDDNNQHENNDDHPNQNEHDEQQNNNNNESLSSTKLFTYANVSFGAAFALLWYAYRTRQQYYLALTFISSSKYAYIILGNAMICSCMVLFDSLIKIFLTNLRLMEREGLSDFCRWNITETCLALTMFRSELNVISGIYFLFLVLAKCLHWVVEQRESHLRMTQDAIIININNNGVNGIHDVVRADNGIDANANVIAAHPNHNANHTPHARGSWWKRLPTLNRNQLGLLGLLQLLLLLDCIAVVCCIQQVATHGPSVHLFFGFETAILLVSCLSLLVLTNLHIIDGIFHYCHDVLGWSNFYMAWKDRKAMLIFAMEVQAQGAKFLFYCAFFGIVFTYYGLPINLFREVYVSFQQLKARFLAFTKYRTLVQGMNRFPSPTEPPMDTCIICRDDMHVHDSKVLACGHLFHTACLRDWLVQQQSCPTCRGDISAMEAARRREQEQQHQQQNEAAAAPQLAEPEAAATTMPTAAAAAQRGTDDVITTSSMETHTEPPSGDTEESALDRFTRRSQGKHHEREQRNLAPYMGLKPSGKVFNKPIDLGPEIAAAAAANAKTKAASSPMFPALYKIVSSTDTNTETSTLGAPVYAFDNDTSVDVGRSGTGDDFRDKTTKTTTFNGYHKVRHIATGTAVLCLEMELQTLGEELGLMLRLPNHEWVWEHDVEYLTHVPTSMSTK